MSVDPNAAILPRLERMIAGLSPAAAERQRRFRPIPDVSIHELATHPDLGDRLRKLAAELPDADVGVVYGYFAARARDARIFALAQGTHTIHFRVGAAGVDAAIHDGATEDADFGADWVTVDAWNAGPPRDVWWAALRAMMRAAYDYAVASAESSPP